MEFQSKIIEKKKNPRARVAAVGVVLFMAGMILSVVHGYEQYALWSFGVGMVLLIGGAVYARGNLTNIGVSDTDVVVNVSSIRIGDMTWPVDQIAGLEFLVEGYDGMVIPGTRGSRQNREDYYNGMNNYFSFVYNGNKVNCRFYLPDPQHVQELGGVFKDFYAHRVEFVERSGGWRTFLFEAVTDAQWEDLMIENGYR
jgi:hypothetical protein